MFVSGKHFRAYVSTTPGMYSQVLEAHPGGDVVQREVSRRQLLRSIGESDFYDVLLLFLLRI